MKLFVHGAAVGLSQITNLKFDIGRPYTYCRICGSLYQSDSDRSAVTDEEKYIASEKRRNWSIKHSKDHLDIEHIMLLKSGLWVTPEAQIKLASFGVISVQDMVFNDEIEAALKESKPIPDNDAEE